MILTDVRPVYFMLPHRLTAYFTLNSSVMAFKKRLDTFIGMGMEATPKQAHQLYFESEFYYYDLAPRHP